MNKTNYNDWELKTEWELAKREKKRIHKLNPTNLDAIVYIERTG